ncbi:hypothetical protein BaRGS_00001400 [Batillaria attramentaria]|uniref:Uncharacterized protein n=1 Tax=Batillaria attramentaria TaxID=370345 RepID=A0ABD0M7J2_9CAEN
MRRERWRNGDVTRALTVAAPQWVNPPETMELFRLWRNPAAKRKYYQSQPSRPGLSSSSFGATSEGLLSSSKGRRLYK